VALAGLLCAGALFLLRSYQEIGARDHGFNPSGALTFQLNIPTSGAPKPGTIAPLYSGILRRIREIPGVALAGASTNLPWSGYDENAGFEIVGQDGAPDQDVGGRYQGATNGYFEASGMRLVSGRFFDRVLDANGQPAALIVNDALANRYFPKGNAVGTKLKLGGGQGRIVGVVAGIEDSPADLDVKPAFWLPLEQQESTQVFFVVRTSSGVDPLSLTAAVTSAVHSTDPELAVTGISSFEARTNRALAARRFALWLFQSFAVLALVLAATGIYALLAYIVQQRRKELGIRVALGASRGDLWSMVLSDGLEMAAAGAVVCLVLIPIGGSLMQAFLFKVRSFDPLTVAGAPAILLAVAVVASLGPARSAMRSDAAIVLRDD
jgi:predicted permease